MSSPGANPGVLVTPTSLFPDPRSARLLTPGPLSLPLPPPARPAGETGNGVQAWEQAAGKGISEA